MLMAMPPMLSDPAGTQVVPFQVPLAAVHADALVGTVDGVPVPNSDDKMDEKVDGAVGALAPPAAVTCDADSEHGGTVLVPHGVVVAPPSAVQDAQVPSGASAQHVLLPVPEAPPEAVVPRPEVEVSGHRFPQLSVVCPGTVLHDPSETHGVGALAPEQS